MNKQNTELVQAIAEAIQPKVEEIKRLKAENAKLNGRISIMKSYIEGQTKLLRNKINQLKAENAKLKEEIEKVTRENLFATANCGRYIREKHELKARVAELEEEISVLKLQLETYCDDCDELIR